VTNSQVTGPGRASPVPVATLLYVPHPIRRRVPGGCDFRFFTASIGLRRAFSGSAPSVPTLTGGLLTTLQVCPSCCGPHSCSPKRALDTGLRPRPFPTRAASLLPGHQSATRTGLTPVSDDEHEQRHHPAKSRGHLPVPLGAQIAKLSELRQIIRTVTALGAPPSARTAAWP